MKIVHVIDYFQPQLGYQETFLAREHGKSGHDVTVLTSDRYYPYASYDRLFRKLLGKRIVGEKESIEEGIKTVRLPTLEIPGTPLVYLTDLNRKLSMLKPDIVYCHNMYSLLSFLIAYYKKGSDYKLIYDTHTAKFNTDLDNSFLKRAYHTFYKKIAVPIIKKNADAIFAIGDEEKNYICEDFNLNKHKVSIIRLGVDTERFSFSEKPRMNIRRKMGLNGKDVVLIFTGKINPGKRLDILIKTVGNIGDALIKVLIIGGGENNYISYLKKLADDCKSNIIWLPFIPNKELPNYYSAADVGTWPGNPSIGIIEAMSTGLPLITETSESIKYLISKNAVISYQSGDIDSFSDKIKKLSYNVRMRKSLGNRSRKFIINNLSWNKIAYQTLNLI